MTGWLADAVGAAVTQPLSHPVPADDAAYRQRQGALRLGWGLLQSRAQLALSRQAPSRRRAVDPAWRRALWVHAAAPQVGVALMDLAPRSLLAAHRIRLELCAAPHLVDLFRGDPWFERGFADPAEIDPMRYDFVIVASNARQALAPKCRGAPYLPWLSLAGDYAVPDYHRGQFNTRRLADALGVAPDDAALRRHARQKLGPPGAPPAGLEVDALPRPRVALALGGMQAERGDLHWGAVLGKLLADGVGAFVLAGSGDASAARDAVLASAPPATQLLDAVARTDLAGTRALFARCDLVIAADGDLMHLALTTDTPVLALFPSTIDPLWRLPGDTVVGTLRSADAELGSIPPEAVARTALALLRRDARMPQPGHLDP